MPNDSSVILYHSQVSAKGYISMGEIPCTNVVNADLTACSVVAPYVANIDIEVAGTVRYTDFNTYSSSGSSMTTVSRFVRDQTGNNFYGTKMMVAEWNGVAQFGGSSVRVITSIGA